MRAFAMLLCLVVSLRCTLPAFAQVPILNSYPSADATLYLDFDGQYVTGSSWNWEGPIDAQPSGLSEETINEIFDRVAEDYRPFNVTLTTDSAVFLAAPRTKRMRLIITPTSEWYGIAGGVSYVGSFGWGDDTPAWVFSELLARNAKFIAEACAHELGHTLGLQHQSEYGNDCAKIFEYNEGRGDGQTGWAPIMGLAYFKNLTTWHLGPSTIGCENLQDDLLVIADHVGFRKDDHSDDPSSATPLDVKAGDFMTYGMINKQDDPDVDDADVFSLDVEFPTRLKLRATPENVGGENEGANLDIRMLLLNSSFDTIGRYDPDFLLDAGIDTTLQKGTYYLAVSGTRSINHSGYGSLGFYLIAGRVAMSLPVEQLVLAGKADDGVHRLSWSYVSDQPVKNVLVEGGPDGRQFHTISTLPGGAQEFSYVPLNNERYYRVRVTMEPDERSYYSNVVSLTPVVTTDPVKFLSRFVSASITLISDKERAYHIFDISGRLLSAGKLVPGFNRVPVAHVPAGPFYMRITNGVAVWTEKLIKQ